MGNGYLPRTDTALGQWTTNFAVQAAILTTSVGITSTQSTQLTNANNSWTSALAASVADATRSKRTIQLKDQAKEAVLAVIRPLVGIIQNYPGTTNDMRLQLGITVRKTPTPAGAPGTPYKLKAILQTNGDLLLTWKNNNAASCVYQVWRQTDGAGPYASLGGTGSKKFTDNTIPVGVTQLKYQIQAVRSTGISTFGILDVQFGPGSTSIIATEGKPLKAAA